eukprot:GHVN01034753.1.p1 GENE.GHVN01034753.1~~GHVN01034753.1.p1  ORF type:complete len:206 (-),score=15.23 GHVN01034753.1:125-742(-)
MALVLNICIAEWQILTIAFIPVGALFTAMSATYAVLEFLKKYPRKSRPTAQLVESPQPYENGDYARQSDCPSGAPSTYGGGNNELSEEVNARQRPVLLGIPRSRSHPSSLESARGKEPSVVESLERRGVGPVNSPIASSPSRHSSPRSSPAMRVSQDTGGGSALSSFSTSRSSSLRNVYNDRQQRYALETEPRNSEAPNQLYHHT